MEKFRTALNKALELLAGLSMAVMVILTTYQVIARYIFNSPSTWSEELVGYLFGWSTLFGATIVSGERGHMNIPILVDRMNPGMPCVEDGKQRCWPGCSPVRWVPIL